MPSSVRMMWPAMIILCVPDLLHIIFSLSSSFGCQARSSYFCQCLVLYLEKRTGMPWGVGKDSLPLPLGLGSLRMPQLMLWNISCYLMNYEVSTFFFFFLLPWLPRNSYPELKRGTQELFLETMKTKLLKTWTFYLWVKVQFLFPFSRWLAQFLIPLKLFFLMEALVQGGEIPRRQWAWNICCYERRDLSQ